jgi:hypothetical protein
VKAHFDAEGISLAWQHRAARTGCFFALGVLCIRNWTIQSSYAAAHLDCLDCGEPRLTHSRHSFSCDAPPNLGAEKARP